jgi:hypothetical protein
LPGLPTRQSGEGYTRLPAWLWPPISEIPAVIEWTQKTWVTVPRVDRELAICN